MLSPWTWTTDCWAMELDSPHGAGVCHRSCSLGASGPGIGSQHLLDSWLPPSSDKPWPKDASVRLGQFEHELDVKWHQIIVHCIGYCHCGYWGKYMVQPVGTGSGMCVKWCGIYFKIQHTRTHPNQLGTRALVRGRGPRGIRGGDYAQGRCPIFPAFICGSTSPNKHF